MTHAAYQSGSRPHTAPHAGPGSPLKAIAYEDATDGVPPVQIRSVSPSPSTAVVARLRNLNLNALTRTTSADSPASPLSDRLKRDSGIASSLLGSESQHSTITNGVGAARSPTLPTIVVQDEDSPQPIERSRSPFSRKKSKEKVQSVKQQEPGIQRVSSFKGIEANIPAGGLDAIDLEDLASDKVGFSQRGSLLFGGKKMNDIIAANGDGVSQANGTSQSFTPILEQVKAQGPQNEVAATPESPKRGLVTGRRKPSVHLLQAALDGGRVLSAEEITFSLRVRSMYEHGDERAGEWVKAVDAEAVQDDEERDCEQDSVPDADTKVVSPQALQQAYGQSIRRAPTAQSMRSNYARDPTELAGGIEDWDEVQGEDVDRYGFIHPKRDVSRPSTTSHNQREGMQRVATALMLESDTPRKERKLRRGISNARSSRSVPPRPSQDDTIRRAPGSMHSFRSTRSAHGHAPPFFSRDRKLLAEAADMLTLPPGLADIAEQEDGGKTLSIQKRRERARDEKWQKMARPLRDQSSIVKGGGMRFEFETSDPKLISRTWKGIPDRWRATAWHSFLSASAKRRGSNVSDETLIEEFYKLQEVSSADDVQIDVDVPRTISMHIMFRRRYRGGRRLLFRILHAISVYCPEPGYVQGMASLAATLLCYYDEEMAFVMMVRLWQLRGLEQLFQSEFVGLIAALNEFEQEWLQGGDVAQKLEELGIPSTSYGTRWYLTLFHLSVPFPAQLRVWDVFMLLGDAPAGARTPFGGADLDVLHATSAALIDATREILVDADFENTMKVLTSFIPIKDEDLLMRVARTEWKMRKKRNGIKG